MLILRKILLIIIIGCLFFIMGVPRLLSLDAHWSSDEARWLNRSAQFMSAVKQGEFSKTLVAYHPGVTTMWLAGLRTFWTEPGIDIPNLAHARWFVGVVVWSGIGIACFLLYKLFGQWIALAGFACLATSPLFLAQARRVHTDALATIFILLTVLLFLLSCQNRQDHRYLSLSGVTFGLALLSKSSALILFPLVPLCLVLFRKKQTGGFWTHIAKMLAFINCTVLTVLTLWPLFWTPIFGLLTLCLLGVTFLLFRGVEKERCPIGLLIAAFAGLVLICVRAAQSVWLVFDRVNWAVTTPHEVEHFFLGKIVNDPGWLFYPFVLTIKSTPLMLPLALLGCFLLWKRRKYSEETSYQFQMALILAAGVFLFMLSLSVTNKKFSRYLLPAFPMLEILAAIGFVEGLKWSYNALHIHFRTEQTASYKNALVVIICIGLFFIQVFPVLALHPYYGTYYNLCWKLTDITQVITVGEASGLDLAAKYLNKKPNAHRMRILVSPLSAQFMEHYFRGFTHHTDRGIGDPINYEVIYIRDSQIGYVPQTGTLNGELEARIALNGIDHVWIYRVQ
ncbi:MAG: glycosyltransferase family 39 protein [Candidatus Poribacteria bacterium]|nr:glycosyltransferase family 39 protein [Candidatus Poribacteria bacterium]